MRHEGVVGEGAFVGKTPLMFTAGSCGAAGKEATYRNTVSAAAGRPGLCPEAGA